MNLASLQLRLQQAVMASTPASPAELVGDARADARSRLAIYRHGYRARLREALSGEFPGLAHLAGRRFSALIDRYIDACPSEHYNLRWYGAGLAAFLSYALPWRDRPALAEAAALDWAISTCFDAADEPVVDVASLAGINPERWGLLRLHPVRHLQWLAIATNVNAFRAAADGGRRRPHLRRYAGPRQLIVWREGITVRYSVLDPDEHALLATAARGATFGALCDIAASRWLGNEAVPRLYALLRGWVDAGLIGSLSLAGEGDDSAAEPAPDGSE